MFHEIAQLKKSSQLLKVLGNAHRLQIIALLLGGEKNVTEINQVVKVSQPALSQHLARLRSIGVLGSRREQRQIIYFITNRLIAKLLDSTAEMAKK